MSILDAAMISNFVRLACFHMTCYNFNSKAFGTQDAYEKSCFLVIMKKHMNMMISPITNNLLATKSKSLVDKRLVQCIVIVDDITNFKWFKETLINK